MYKEEFLEFINSLAKKYNPLVVSDEVNNQNVYPPYKFISPSNFINSDRLISVNSFSKNYFLPGVRLGWVIAREEITKKIKNAMAVSQVSINCPSQVIAYSIVENCKEELTLFKKELQDKKNEGEKILKENDISCLQPVTGGTVFFIETEVNSEKLVNHLLNYCKVGAIPGIYFGEKWKNWLRVGFGAVSSSDFKKAISSIKQATYDCK
jgi:aspartate/methionine/tyrosine aminotransferase